MRLILLSIQWAIFILAGSVVAPIAIGAAFHLPLPEIAGFLQRSLFVIGIASLLQVFFGHRLPIAEGPAGLWWGVFMIFAGAASAMNVEAHDMLQNLQMGVLISGVCFLLMSTMRMIHRIKTIFTPLVTGTYLFLLIAQLSGPFVKGILGIGYFTPQVDGRVAVSALLTLVFTAGLAKSSYPKLRSFSILYGIIFGWILFALLGITKPIHVAAKHWIEWPQPLVWGMPAFDASVMITAIITALLLLSNLIASIEVVQKVVGQQTAVDYNRSGFIMGINQILAGIFSTMGFVPMSTSVGFINTTKIKEKLPFMIGSSLILCISFFPSITLFFASLPVPVGYATTFLAFAHLIILALKEYGSVLEEDNKLSIVAASLMVGIGSMFVPVEGLSHLPGYLISLLNNGLILGVLTCIILEQGTRRIQEKRSGR
jgi:xanthine/uracil permease